MGTDEGLQPIRRVRKNIELLRDRMEYLCDKQAQLIDDRGHTNDYAEAEIRALEWALPILETEWDNLVRLRTFVMRKEGRSENQIADHEQQWSKARASMDDRE